jgi:hypothetical protein
MTGKILILILLVLIPDMINAEELQPQQTLNTPWYLMGGFFTGFAALLIFFSKELFNYLRRPQLVPDFDMNDKRCFHKIRFYKLFSVKDPITKTNYILKQPGFNSRVMIHNKGYTPAKNVLARIESIALKGERVPFFYHPTAVKWSGEKEYNKIDIAPHSYFLLDLIRIITETKDGLIELYPDLEDLIKIIKDERLSGKTYWDVWVDKSHDRGIPNYYMADGNYELKYIVTGDNCAAVTFKVNLQWKKAEWNNPQITLDKEKEVPCQEL